jgi:hypothetical protein
MPSRSAASRWFPLDSASALRIKRTLSSRTSSASDAIDAAVAAAVVGATASEGAGEAQHLTPAEHEGALDDVAQLADVARLRVRPERL